MTFKRICIFWGIGFFYLTAVSFGQTNPVAQTLPYSQDFSSLLYTSTTYLSGWQGWQLSASGASGSFRTTAPTANIAMTASSTATITAAGVYNYNGKIGILETGGSDPSICLAINTTSCNGIVVSYDAMTIRNPYNGTTDTRINEFTLQYRVGTSGLFSTIDIAYQNNATSQTGAVTTPQNSQTKTITLPSVCENQSVIQLRWAARDASGGGSRSSFAIDNISITSCNTNTSTYYYRSISSGNWDNNSTWEASPDGISGWVSVCSPPTNLAALVTIQNGHTVTIDGPSTCPDLIINNGGTLTANSSNFTTLTISGNLQNDGTLQLANGVFGVDVVFTKNGNQTITGSGAITNFYSIGLNMGASVNNILDISSTNFSSSTNLLVNSSGTNSLLKGTIKFSGTYTFSNQLFASGPIIASNSGIWLNNSNVTITAGNFSYNVSGLIRITSGTYNIGAATGNSLYLLSNSKLTIEGGSLNVATRIDANTSAGAVQSNVAYRQSAGIVQITTFQNTHGTLADFSLPSPNDSLIMSGGTIIFRNVASTASDLINNSFSTISGGLMQFGDISTTIVSTGFEIESGGANSFLPSLLINNSSGFNPILYPGTDILVKGNITINNGTTLDNYWGIQAGINYYYNFSLTGNWNNSGTFFHNNLKTVTFNGTSAQTISGATSTGFNNLTINNSSGGVTLNTPALINGTTGILTLMNGYLYTSSINTFTMNAGTSATGANNNSFVYGPLTKTGLTDFIFPVGKDVEYRPISITSLSGSETFTAEYFHADPNAVPFDVTLKDATLDDIGRCEYWILNRAGSINANVTLSWDTYSCGVTSLPDLSVARWDSGLGMWKDEGNTATTGAADPSTGTVTSGLVTSFSPFTLASKVSGVNPLPIELLSFTAKYISSQEVDINWSTASELNNDYFTIERSKDAISFDEINITDGAGNSNSTLNYSTTDDSPLAGISYYRLKQTDFNGDFKYSNTVTVQNYENNFDIVSTHYSQSSNQYAIYFNCNSECLVTLELYDIRGQKVYTSFENTLGTNSEVMIPTKNLSEGIYLIKVYNGNKLISRKIKL
ncbi:MAG: T9SS type A sorting domain-containing protein [Bacteroidetes bacterium]|nr:T9SS type A sorting domain-containing protein [Bacteroidota bacterium]